MKEFLTMLFFGSSLLLTTAPIDIGKEWVNLIPKKPIEAVNGGARLCLDITKAIGKIDDTGVLDKMLPAGTIEAELIAEKGASFTLRNSGSYSFQYASGVVSNVCVNLKADSEVRTNIKFNRVRLRSSITLKPVTITWINYSL